MSNIAAVIGWKFNHQAGMETEDGVIIKFPGGIPSQEDQDAWTAEYLARDIDAERLDRAFPQTDVAQVIVQAFLTMENQIRTLQDDLSIIADPLFIRRLPLIKQDIIDWLKARLP